MCPQAVALRAERKRSRTGRTAWKTSWTSRCGSGTKTSPTRKTSLLDAADARRCATQGAITRSLVFAQGGPRLFQGEALSMSPEQPSDDGAEELAGERWPLSRAVGTGEFYVSFAPRTSVSLRRVCRLHDGLRALQACGIPCTAAPAMQARKRTRHRADGCAPRPTRGRA